MGEFVVAVRSRARLHPPRQRAAVRAQQVPVVDP